MLEGGGHSARAKVFKARGLELASNVLTHFHLNIKAGFPSLVLAL